MAALVAAAGLASPATSNAEPAGHQVRYTLVSAGDADFDLFYLVNQPADKAAYNADSYAYLKKEEVTLAAGVPALRRLPAPPFRRLPRSCLSLFA